jgi:two-component system, OmpR family, response regulator
MPVFPISPRVRARSQEFPRFASDNGGVSDEQELLRVLVVDDEPNIVDVVSMALRHHGFDVAAADTGVGALAAVREWHPHVLVLDVMLPDMDGFEVAQRLSGEHVGVPILFLSARDTTADRVRGLTAGGDDYVTKPFSLEELIARLRIILRRTGALREVSSRLVFADLELDEETRDVSRDGRSIELTATEYRLLRYLMLNPRRVLTRAQLLDHVWSYDYAGDARVLETYMSYLRKKVDASPPPLLHTVRGVGYALRLPRG